VKLISIYKKVKIERKKTKKEIIENIYDVLQDGKIHTISDISHQIKSHWRTVKNQVDIILKIQEKPKIEILRASKQTLVRII